MSVTFLNLRFELSDSIQPIKDITYTGTIFFCCFLFNKISKFALPGEQNHCGILPEGVFALNLYSR